MLLLLLKERRGFLYPYERVRRIQLVLYGTGSRARIVPRSRRSEGGQQGWVAGHPDCQKGGRGGRARTKEEPRRRANACGALLCGDDPRPAQCSWVFRLRIMPRRLPRSGPDRKTRPGLGAVREEVPVSPGCHATSHQRRLSATTGIEPASLCWPYPGFDVLRESNPLSGAARPDSHRPAPSCAPDFKSVCDSRCAHPVHRAAGFAPAAGGMKWPASHRPGRFPEQATHV